MNLKKISITFVLIIVSAVFITGANDSYHYKVNKSFELFGELFREISTNYVDEVDPEILVRHAIDGMLEYLDVYTVYYNEMDSGDLDILANGAYTGMGITVSNLDSMLTVTSVAEGYPAHKAGIRRGDRIQKIDSVEVLDFGSRELRPYTDGKAGTQLDVWILRDGLDDTLKFTLERERIMVNDVPYHGFIDSGYAYIRLERFSRGSENEIRSKLNTMKYSTDSLRGIILDLRDNPGGLLDVAVSISEIFVDEGDKIVSTKGRFPRTDFTYSSRSTPVFPETPLIILINEYSASASEVVAGAIQDLDRGVILGRTSYGKGLVQSVFSLPYDGNLKMTTAKYYTPSGRCIQKLDLIRRKNINSDSAIEEADTNVFQTRNGRPVHEFKGIKPDSLIDAKQNPEFIRDLIMKHMFFNFANIYTAKLDAIPADFRVDDEIIDEFTSFLGNKNYNYKPDIIKEIEKLKELAEKENINGSSLKEINDLKRTLEKDNRYYIGKYTDEVIEHLEFEIKSRFLTESNMIAAELKKDVTTQTALDIFKTGKYKSFLNFEPNSRDTTDTEN